MSKDERDEPTVSAGERSDAAALTDAKALCSRINLKADEAFAIPALKEALLVYGMDVSAVVRWYDVNSANKKSEYTSQRRVALGLIILIIAALAVGALFEPQRVTTQLILVAAACLSGLKAWSGATDLKAQWTIFWKAGASLKDADYTFVHKWRRSGIKLTDAAAVDTLCLELWNQIVAARKTVRDEKESYFQTFQPTSDMLTGALSTVDLLRQRGAEVQTLRSTADAQAEAPNIDRAKRIADARAKVIEAQADVDAANQREKETAAASGVSADAITQSKLARIGADAQLTRAKAILAALQ